MHTWIIFDIVNKCTSYYLLLLGAAFLRTSISLYTLYIEWWYEYHHEPLYNILLYFSIFHRQRLSGGIETAMPYERHWEYNQFDFAYWHIYILRDITDNFGTRLTNAHFFRRGRLFSSIIDLLIFNNLIWFYRSAEKHRLNADNAKLLTSHQAGTHMMIWYA